MKPGAKKLPPEHAPQFVKPPRVSTINRGLRWL